MKISNIIAHRGANLYAPQNTLPAFEKAFEIGCDGVETDVHLTKDGIPVLCHNFTVDETSDGTGAIKDMTLAELRELDFGSYRGREFEGTKIPTLDEFLELCSKNNVGVLDIEIKSEVFGKAGTELAEKTIAAVIEHGLIDNLLISSFDPQVLVDCKKIDPRCKTGILYSPDSLVSLKIAPRPVKFAREIKADALHPLFLYVNRLYVERAHRAGIQVNPWTIDKDIIGKRLSDIGCDGIITDCPDTMNAILGK